MQHEIFRIQIMARSKFSIYRNTAEPVSKFFRLQKIRPTLVTGTPQSDDEGGPAQRIDVFKMIDQSRHRSVETLRGYVRDPKCPRTLGQQAPIGADGAQEWGADDAAAVELPDRRIGRKVQQ
jgi:hypothetical protein